MSSPPTPFATADNLSIDGWKYPLLSFLSARPYLRDGNEEYYKDAYEAACNLGYTVDDFNKNIIKISKGEETVYCLTDMFVGMTQALSGPGDLKMNNDFRNCVNHMVNVFSGYKRVDIHG
jgi:hypothetical protein